MFWLSSEEMGMMKERTDHKYVPPDNLHARIQKYSNPNSLVELLHSRGMTLFVPIL